jgi:hypothetical protein
VFDWVARLTLHLLKLFLHWDPQGKISCLRLIIAVNGVRPTAAGNGEKFRGTVKSFLEVRALLLRVNLDMVVDYIAIAIHVYRRVVTDNFAALNNCWRVHGEVHMRRAIVPLTGLGVHWRIDGR